MDFAVLARGRGRRRIAPILANTSSTSNGFGDYRIGELRTRQQVGSRGDGNDGRVRRSAIRLQHGKQVQARLLWQDEIEQHERRRMALEEPQGGGSVGRF